MVNTNSEDAIPLLLFACLEWQWGLHLIRSCSYCYRIFLDSDEYYVTFLWCGIDGFKALQ